MTSLQQYRGTNREHVESILTHLQDDFQKKYLNDANHC